MNDHFVSDNVDDGIASRTTSDRISERNFDDIAFVHHRFGDAADGTTVNQADDDILRHVNQLTGQVTRVSGLERGIGQALTRTVRRGEVLEHFQAFAEVCANRGLDDFAIRLGHQTTQTTQLTNLSDRTTRTRRRHDVHRIDVFIAITSVVTQTFHQRFGQFFGRVRPGFDDIAMLL